MQPMTQPIPDLISWFASELEGDRPKGGRRGGRCAEGRGMSRRQRTPRGDIKYILLALLAEQPQHGYQLMKELESRWGGFYRPSPGSVYPTLQLLEEGGYLTSESVEGKRVYTITESGRELLAQQSPSGGTPSRAEEQPQLAELQSTLVDVREALMQLARSGDETRIARAIASLKQLKREVYQMLAEED